MYHIGYIKLSDFDKEKYIHSIEKECVIEKLDRNRIGQLSQSIDGIIIFGTNDDIICEASEMILKIREQSNAFIWIAAQKMNNISKVVFLQLGADSIFDDEQTSDIFRLTITNALKRNQLEQPRIPIGLDSESGSFTLDSRNQVMRIEGKPTAPLTNLEYRTLQVLADNMGNTVTYEEIFEAVWHQKYNNEKYRIANIMFHIREKIEREASSPVFIKTVRSRGYVLCNE
ncbi:winged helix-turn-helix domain-containing protein [Enterococcus rotai]|uniref:winged helix-turn-helix domain-containing protein n=1 Tax=Enterococcus rotai TaxID=118060 RepID=UPI0035C6CBD6